jgi:hypothetical protein
MPVDNQAPIVAASGKKRFADPDQVARLLRVQRSLRIDTAMNKKAPAVIVTQGQRAKPVEDRCRQLLHPSHTVTAERSGAALAEPNIRRTRPVTNIERNRLVVALKRNETFAAARLHFHQIRDHAGTIGTAIDIVAEKDEG